jgi:hypothetical protein
MLGEMPEMRPMRFTPERHTRTRRLQASCSSSHLSAALHVGENLHVFDVPKLPGNIDVNRTRSSVSLPGSSRTNRERGPGFFGHVIEPPHKRGRLQPVFRRGAGVVRAKHFAFTVE